MEPKESETPVLTEPKPGFDPKDPNALLYVVRGVPKPITPWWVKLLPFVVFGGLLAAWFATR